MRCIFFILCMIACFGKTFSQNRLYIRPVIETGYCKTHHSQTLPGSPWFKYTAHRFVWTREVSMGIMLGYQFNKNRTYIEMGLQQAKAESEWELSFSEYKPASSNGTYSDSHLGMQDYVKGIKIPILLSTQLLYWDSLRLNKARNFSIHCNFIIGVAIHHKKYTEYIPKINKNVMISSGTLMNVQSYTYSGNAPHTFLPETGFSIDFRKNKKEWGTLTLYGLFSIGRRSSWGIYQSIFIKVTDIPTNKSFSYFNYTSGSGSGIFIAISKKLFYPRPKETKFIRD